jgi:hypothetical protein
VLCCAAAAVLFSTRFLPHVLLATAMSLPVAVRGLREEARVTWVCWCWLLRCHGALVFLPAGAIKAKAGPLPVVRPVVRPGLTGVDAAAYFRAVEMGNREGVPPHQSSEQRARRGAAGSPPPPPG